MFHHEDESLIFENYQIQNKLGEGSFACVYRGIHLLTKMPVALKVFSKQNLQDPENEALFQAELMVAQTANHPLLVTLFDIIENEKSVALVMEYLEGGSLLDYINNSPAMPHNLTHLFFQQIIASLDYLHNELHVVHRDLKAENILLDRNLNVRIIDFGFARTFSEVSPLKTVCGSPAYAAPELIQGQNYTEAVDIWSAGIVLYAMSYGTLPFYSDNLIKLFSMIAKENPTQSESSSPDLRDLISRMLDKNPLTRITLDEILKHPWFLNCKTDHRIYKDPKVQIKDRVDEDVIRTLISTKIPFQKDHIVEFLRTNQYDPQCAPYRIVKRQRVTQMLVVLLSPRKMNNFPVSTQFSFPEIPNMRMSPPDPIPFGCHSHSRSHGNPQSLPSNYAAGLPKLNDSTNRSQGMPAREKSTPVVIYPKDNTFVLNRERENTVKITIPANSPLTPFIRSPVRARHRDRALSFTTDLIVPKLNETSVRSLSQK